MDDSILIDEVGEQEEYGSVPEPYTACSSSVQPPEFELEVEIVKPPCLGMCFETLEAAKQFYIDYGKLFGFSPVIRSSEKSYSRSDEVSNVQITCSRFGIYRDRGSKNMNVDGTEKEVRKRNTNTVKCRCLASMRVTKQQNSGIWKVVKFTCEHNHNLVSPQKDRCETDETYQLMLQRLQELSMELKKKEGSWPRVYIVNSCTVGDSSVPPLDDPSQVLLQNPNISQTKGRKKVMKIYKKTKASGRIKGGLEQASQKAKAKTERRCTCCNKVGVNHDRQNCPENPNRKKGPIVDVELELEGRRRGRGRNENEDEEENEKEDEA
ncbi:hypothetical protein IFM89_025681 [Coptis chinensis]|uniref:FAR1 domain-containing protein n=1 Tax=Coptis chinensis TaxID=261450 RepID=A0A835LCL3_9MAGN|nr:hypothetical protein IFM89_025681 [Coptis chinensis]